MNRIGKAAQRVSVYTIGNALNSGVPFLILPFLTKYLTPKEIGIIAVYQLIVQFLVPLIGFGGETVISRSYHKTSEQRFHQIWNNSIWWSFILTVLVFVASFILNFFNLNFLLIISATGYAFFTKVIDQYSTVLRMRGKAWGFASLRISRSLLDVTTSIILVYFVSADADSRILGQLSATVFVGLILIVLMRHRNIISSKLNKGLITWSIALGFPLVIHLLFSAVVGYVDRLFIERYIGLNALGIYAVAFQVAQGIALVQNSFNQAWVPWLFKNMANRGSESSRLEIARYSILYFLFLLIFAISYLEIVPLFFDIFIDVKYHGAIDLVYFIGFAYLLNGYYKMFVNYVVFDGKTQSIALISAIAGVLSVVLNFILVPQFGLKGAALSSVMTFGSQFLITAYIAHKKFPLPWLKVFKQFLLRR